MAGTSKSYLRLSPSSWVTTTTTHPDWGTTMTTIEQFEYNPGQATMTAEGLCTANTGDTEYFAQTSNDGGVPGGGPEKGFGGVQIDAEGNPVTKSHYSP